MKTIVVSGVTLRKGGTLTILRETLEYLSQLAMGGEYRVIALVHKQSLCNYPNIEYLEMPDVTKGWLRRLWCEYVTMYRISCKLSPVYMWLSMHDVSPRVKSQYQAVYCQTSFPFYKWKWRDFFFDAKIPMFALFTRFYYRANVHSNRYLVVQQEWLRQSLSRMLEVSRDKIIVAPPKCSGGAIEPLQVTKEVFTFFYASTADCHKNFETLCKAAAMLERKVGAGQFRVVLTVAGNENRYARWLYKRWGSITSIDFHGLMDKATLFGYYKVADCLVFPSNIETWGLPITEYMKENPEGALILSDLPYARATAGGSSRTAFFTPDNASNLMELMYEALLGTYTSYGAIPKAEKLQEPTACSWQNLFDIILS